jgi:hypothetical protein
LAKLSIDGVGKSVEDEMDVDTQSEALPESIRTRLEQFKEEYSSVENVILISGLMRSGRNADSPRVIHPLRNYEESISFLEVK